MSHDENERIFARPTSGASDLPRQHPGEFHRQLERAEQVSEAVDDAWCPPASTGLRSRKRSMGRASLANELRALAPCEVVDALARR